MPAEDKISSIVDFGAIDAEQKRLASIIDGIVKQLKSAPTIKIGIEGAPGVKDLSKENMRLAESIKAVEALMRQRFATEAKLATLQTDYARATATARVETQKQTKELKDQASAELAVIGSRERALAQIKVLTAQKDKLNLLNETEKKQYDDLVVKIEKYDKFLKSTGTSAEKQRANIGNYSGAVNVLKLSLEEVSKKIDANTKAGKGNSDVVKALEKEYAILNQLVNSQAAGFATAAAEIKENQKALLQMEQAGLRGTDAFNKLALATGQLKDDVADLKARTKTLGSDTFVFDSMIQGAQTLAGAYGVAQGAAALFGDENEELQKTFVKLQAIMTVIQGLQSISNGIQKESAFILGLQTARTKILAAVETLRQFVLRGTVAATIQNTVATTAQTGAMVATTTATRAATGAMVGLRFALIATGIGALLVLLASAASAMGTLGKETKETTFDLEKFNSQLEFSNRLLDSTISSIQVEGQIREQRLRQRGASEKELHFNRMEYLQKEKEALIEDANIKDQQLKKDIANGKIKSDAANKMQDDIDTKRSKSNEIESQRFLLEETFKADQAQKTRDQQKESANKSEAEKKKFRDDAAKRAEDYAKRETAAYIEIIRQGYEQEKKLAKEAVDNQQLTEEERLQNLAKFAKASQALIDFEKNNTLGDKSKTSNEKKLAQQKAAFDSLELTKQVSAETSKILKEGFERDEKSLQDHVAVLNQAQEEKFRIASDKIDVKANNSAIDIEAEYEIKIAKATGKERERLEQELQDKLIEIDRNAALEKLKIRETELLQQFGLATLHGLDTTEIEKSITENLRAQSKIRGEIRQGEADDEEKLNAEKREKLDNYLLYAKEGLSLIQTFRDAAFTNEKNRIQEEMNLNDERTRREIDAVNASTLSEQDKAAKISIINARATAEKERNQRRQKQLDYDKARFDKQIAILTLIAQIAIDIAKQQYQAAALAGVALIKLIATPLPKFEKGTDNAPKGLALVSEKGSELIQTKDGKTFLSPSQPTLMQMAGGERITPAHITLDILKANNLLHILQQAQSAKQPVPIYEDFFGEKTFEVWKRIERKPPVIVHVHPSYESSAHYNYHIKH